MYDPIQLANMRDNRKFIFFCLSWFFLLIGSSSKSSLNENASDSEIFERQKKEFGLIKETQSLRFLRSISKLHLLKPTNGVTVVAFGTKPFSIVTLKKISRSEIEKQHNGKTNDLRYLKSRKTEGKKQVFEDTFLNWINAIVSKISIIVLNE